MAWLVAADPLPVGVKPDAIDWLTAIGTVGAVFVAVGVAVVEGLRAAKARHEGDELAASQRPAERRATARLVSAWVERTYVAAGPRRRAHAGHHLSFDTRWNPRRSAARHRRPDRPVVDEAGCEPVPAHGEAMGMGFNALVLTTLRCTSGRERNAVTSMVGRDPR